MVKITTMTNGPLVIEGSFLLCDENGESYGRLHGAHALCRCGESARSPYCDGTHTNIGFVCPSRAAAEQRSPPEHDRELGVWENEGGSPQRPRQSPHDLDHARAHAQMHRLLSGLG
jgi:CDGSH-type Zn-finger protein